MTYTNEMQKYKATISYLNMIENISEEQKSEIAQLIEMYEKKISQKSSKEKSILVEKAVMKYMTTEPKTINDLYIALFKDNKVEIFCSMPTIQAACKRLVKAGKIVREDIISVSKRKILYAYKLS